MDYIVVAILTALLSFAILNIVKKNENLFSTKITYRQSDMHNLIKSFNSNKNSVSKKITQMSKRLEENSIKIVQIESSAYWVVDNVFYVAEIVDGVPDIATASPVDTSNMTKDDIDKMLFILDNLDRGNKHERGSTGN